MTQYSASDIYIYISEFHGSSKIRWKICLCNSTMVQVCFNADVSEIHILHLQGINFVGNSIL